MMNREQVLFVVGLLLALTGAFLLWNGSIFGERTTGIAIMSGIGGISRIAKLYAVAFFIIFLWRNGKYIKKEENSLITNRS